MRCRRHQNKWTIFCSWHRRHNVSSTSVEQIDFLLFLRSSQGLATSTIKGYRAMVNSVFRHRGLDLLTDTDIGDLIKSLDTAKQEGSDSVSWNLDVVLKWLSGLSFEPLQSTSLRDLTRKTISSCSSYY